MKRFFALVTATVALAGTVTTAGPAHADSTASETLRVDVTRTPPPNRLMLGSGVVLLSFAYVDSFFVATLSDRNADKRLYIPVVGPWLDLTERDCAAAPCSREWLSGALLVVDGVVQGLGAATIVGSLFVPDRKVNVTRLSDRRVHVGPAAVGPGGYGVAVRGAF